MYANMGKTFLLGVLKAAAWIMGGFFGLVLIAVIWGAASAAYPSIDMPEIIITPGFMGAFLGAIFGVLVASETAK